ncbi:hypothetical protein E2C01_027783 [Portunus trituberculatus]|uniref:Uncharacterized protein n=1 Tax=Portunus trituberculatus TaxID=210409 RepID=A0A5B7EMG8_PORTR|nr:hypothetical protein [Portunus trituberculatus]
MSGNRWKGGGKRGGGLWEAAAARAQRLTVFLQPVECCAILILRVFLARGPRPVVGRDALF